MTEGWESMLAPLDIMAGMPEGASLGVVVENSCNKLYVQNTTKLFGLRALSRYWHGDSRKRTTDFLETLTSDLERVVNQLLQQLQVPGTQTKHFLTWTQVAEFGQLKVSLKMIVELIEKALVGLDKMNKDQYKLQHEPMNKVCQRLRDIAVKGRVALDQLSQEGKLRITLTGSAGRLT